MKLSRLRGRKNNEFVLKNGLQWKGKTMTIRYLKAHPKNLAAVPSLPMLYLGTYASTHLSSSSVERNRMRRRCREAVRLAVEGAESLPTVQVLMTPKSMSAKCPFPLIQEDVAMFLRLLGT